MKGLRNKVILSGIVLMFAFIATIGSTYAWFTVSTEATVSDINLQVAASQNLLITPADYTSPGNDDLTSLQDAAYYPVSLIGLSQLQAKGYLPSGESAWRLKPSTIYGGSSTATSIALEYIDNFESVRAGTETVLSYANSTPNSPTGHYIHLNFWLLSQSPDDQDLFLENLSITTTNTGAQSAITSSVRVAFAFNDLTKNFTGAYAPSQTTGTPAIYGIDADTSYVIDADGTPMPLTPPTPTPPTVNVPVTTTPSLYVLQENQPVLVSVEIFVEGWDEDANNDVILASFDISFGFSIATVTP